MYLHGAWSFHYTRETRLEPMFVHCKWLRDPSFLLPALTAFDSIIRPRPGEKESTLVVPWKERTDSRLFWRARGTGIEFDTGWDWRESHRVRLHFLANPRGENRTQEVELLVEEPSNEPLSVWDSVSMSRKPAPANKLRLKSFPREELNKKYFDMGLVGPLLQCDAKDRTVCDAASSAIEWLEAVPQSKGQDAKFVIDVGTLCSLPCIRSGLTSKRRWERLVSTVR